MQQTFASLSRHCRSIIVAALLASIGGPLMAATVSGTASYRERIALPPDAVFEAVLQDVSRADAPAQVLGRATLDPAGQPPFQFNITYDDKVIVPGHSYAVRATVRQQGRLLFTTDTHIPAFADGNPPLQIRLVAVSKNPPPTTSTTIPDQPLRNTYWKLVRLNNAPVTVAERQREPHIIFSLTELRLSGHGGCNSVTGSFEVENEQLRLKELASTMMACQAGMAQETQFLRTLDTVVRYHISGQRLALFNEQGQAVAHFKAVALY